MLVKEKLHKIIDEIEDETLLEGSLSLVSNLNSSIPGEGYDSLTEKQQAELKTSYRESFDNSRLVSNDRVKAKYM